MKKGIYKLHFDCGRMGDLEGIFIAPKEHVDILIKEGIEVYFGEVLGKHSEITGPIEKKDITLVSDSLEAINIIEELDLETGYNPFAYQAINFSYKGLSEEECEDILVSEAVKKIIELKKSKRKTK